MMYALIFEDDADHADQRALHMAEHLQFLVNNSDRIKAAGPLKESASAKPAGGMWLVEADNPGQVQDLIEADPFWPTGLRKSVRLLLWAQVFANGKQLI